MSRSYEGGCHCGAIRWVFTTGVDSSQWNVRACQCSFCRMHGARCTSDPHGTVEFSFADRGALERYRFGLETADFLVCARCGVYVGAVVETAAGAYTTINLNTLSTTVEGIPDAAPVHYDSESTEDRIERRTRKWTPVIASRE